MTAAAGWLPDPTASHQLRYWNGSAWTEHVADGGVSAVDPLAAGAEPPPPADPAMPPPAAGTGSAKASWKERFKQVADQGKAMAEQARSTVTEQQAKRTSGYDDDPSTLWHGGSMNAATSKLGISTTHYRITKDRVWIDSGVLGTRSESVPLWAVKDMDIRQAVWQRGKDVGDVVLVLEDATFTTGSGGMFDLTGTGGVAKNGQVVLDNIEHPHEVYQLLAPLVSEARSKKMIERQSQYLHQVPVPGATQPPAAPPVAATPAAPDLADQLRRLAALRDEGILTEEEFAAQKAKLLA